LCSLGFRGVLAAPLGVLPRVRSRSPAEIWIWPEVVPLARALRWPESVGEWIHHWWLLIKGLVPGSPASEVKLWILPRPAVVAGEVGLVVVGMSASSSRPAVEARGSRSFASSSSSSSSGCQGSSCRGGWPSPSCFSGHGGCAGSGFLMPATVVSFWSSPPAIISGSCPSSHQIYGSRAVASRSELDLHCNSPQVVRPRRRVCRPASELVVDLEVED
jgi:hypothetical protein